MRRSESVKKTGNAAGNGMKAAFLAAAVLATAGVVFYFGTAAHAAKASGPGSAERGSARQGSANPTALVSKALSLPMFFEPNQGQTDPQVKFLARGAGYGLFLTADEAVLELQHPALSTQHSAVSSQPSSSVIRMRLDGANASSRVSGASPLPGKSNYFIGNDPSQWHHDIPQFARVQYQAVYPGVDLVYYGNQGQLEYDFRVAPGAEPNQIALSFTGASARIDAGDLILSTANGDVRFNAPIVYQQNGNNRQSIAGSFRQLAGNKIGFTIGDYDHRRELVIDPILTYSTYLGGGGESLVKVAINSADWIYVAGSTTSADFPLSTKYYPNNPPYQSTLGGNNAQNVFIAVINPALQPPQYLDAQQLLYATYLGGSQIDSLAGIAVDASSNIYVAGSTTSPDFPTTSNAFQTAAAVAGNFPGTHGFVSALSLGLNSAYTLTYSTYLAGNGADTVTGMAIDNSCSTQQSGQAACNAYVTGVTTSTNGPGDGFPANAIGYQTQSNSSGNLQFFASKIYPGNSGPQSMLYSTYLGGGNFGTTDMATGGGIAVDPSGTNVNMYITGATNMLAVAGNGGAAFPILNAQQSCLNQASQTSSCTNSPTATDAFVAKINPNYTGLSSLIYSTYLGGSDNDVGIGIAVDTSSNAYVTGSTSSNNWVCSGCVTGFQTNYAGGTNSNAFIVKIGSQTGTGAVYPLTYFTYLGGSGPDSGQDIKVDSVGAAHVVGTTSSTVNFPVTTDALQTVYGGGDSDAFVALISTTLSGTFPLTPAGDYVTYLGGSGTDQGTGIAVDPTFGAAYVAGTTQSTNFPFPPPGGLTPFQGTLIGTQNAFVSEIGAKSVLAVTVPSTSPSPNPVAAGTQVAFTFNITNTGPDNANFVQFYATGLPITGLAKPATATVTGGGSAASCGAVQGSTIVCYIPTLAVCTTTPPPCSAATVAVDVTPASPVIQTPISISGYAIANGSSLGGSSAQQPAANVVDFNISASPYSQTIVAGDTATFQVFFTPTSNLGYNATITPSQTTSPSMVTATAPTFNPTTVTLSGSGSASTTLSVATVARPVNTGSLLRRRSFYAAWLPIGGLSLVGLGIGAGRKRRRWLAGAVLGLIAGVILLQPGCGSASTSTATPGGTQAGTYIITITGAAGTEASHTHQVTLIVQ